MAANHTSFCCMVLRSHFGPIVEVQSHDHCWRHVCTLAAFNHAEFNSNALGVWLSSCPFVSVLFFFFVFICLSIVFILPGRCVGLDQTRAHAFGAVESAAGKALTSSAGITPFLPFALCSSVAFIFAPRCGCSWGASLLQRKFIDRLSGHFLPHHR